MREALEQRLAQGGFETQRIRTRTEDRAQLDERFQTLTAVLRGRSTTWGMWRSRSATRGGRQRYSRARKAV